MKKKKKNKGGRPSKYMPGRACRLVLRIAEIMTPQNFAHYCSVYHLAVLLGVHIDTIYEWQKQHPEFSDAIKRWETKRNATAFEFRGWSDARWIFCMKNWTGMTDKHDIDMPREFTIKVKRIITDQKLEE